MIATIKYLVYLCLTEEGLRL